MSRKQGQVLASYLQLGYNCYMKNDFKQLIHRHGIKATPGRIRLLEFLAKAPKPVSIKEIAKVVGSNTFLDQATIYRTLELFKNLGIVRQIDFQKGYAYYESADRSDHHHLVCRNCGRVEDFTGCNAEDMIKHALKQSKLFSNVEEHSLELFGLCNSCAK